MVRKQYNLQFIFSQTFYLISILPFILIINDVEEYKVIYRKLDNEWFHF